MSVLSFEAVTHGELRAVSASFDEQPQVVLGTEADGTNTLLRLAAGSAPPARGRVLFGAAEPSSSAALRRHTAALFADEALPPARTVQAALTFALHARADARSARSVLDPAGLASWATRRPAELGAHDTRALALVLALSHPAPKLVLLHDPLSLVGVLAEAFIVWSLSRFTSAIRLCTTSRLADAAHLGRVVGTLERGQWLNAAQATPTPGSIALRVHTPEAERLAAQLAQAPDIAAVEWAGGAELVVHGPELARVAHRVVANARAEGIRIDALKQAPPGLEELAAARAALAQSSLERTPRPANDSPP